MMTQQALHHSAETALRLRQSQQDRIRSAEDKFEEEKLSLGDVTRCASHLHLKLMSIPAGVKLGLEKL
jgi:hypothetical protein